MEDDRDETNRPAVLRGHPDEVAVSSADRLNCLRLAGRPVGIHAPEDLRAQHAAHRLKHRLPGADRELHHRTDVAFL